MVWIHIELAGSISFLICVWMPSLKQVIYINFPKLLNFILGFLQESGERHLHHRPSSWFANLSWFWYFQEVSTCKGLSSYFETMKLQERKGNNRNCGGFYGNFVVSLSSLAWGWSMLGGTDGASKVPRSFGQEEANMEAQGWNRYEIDLWLTGLVSNQGKSIMSQSAFCAVFFHMCRWRI